MKNKTIKKQVVFFILLYYILYNSGPASTIRETDDEKKHLHFVKYDPKKLKRIILVRRLCWYHILFNQKSKIYFVLLYEIFSNKTIFYFLAG